MQHLVDLGDENFELDFNAIFRLGLYDTDPAVRAAAINGLWEDVDPALIAPLLNLLQTDDSEAVRAAAASVLGQFVYEGELEELRCRQSEAHHHGVEGHLSGVSQTDRGAPPRAGITGLSRRRRHQPDDRAGLSPRQRSMKLSAVFAMGRSLDAERWGSIVVEELAAPDPEMRYEAARAAGELEYAPAVRKLGDLLDDVDEEVQLITVWSLGQIGGEKAKQLLMAVLDSDAEHLHEEAEDALAELEFKTDNLDFTMFDFEDDDEEEWVLDAES